MLDPSTKNEQVKRLNLKNSRLCNDDCIKVYMSDTGLLMVMLEEGSQEDIIDGNLGIYKGAIYENIIADIFNKPEFIITV